MHHDGCEREGCSAEVMAIRPCAQAVGGSKRWTCWRRWGGRRTTGQPAPARAP